MFIGNGFSPQFNTSPMGFSPLGSSGGFGSVGGSANLMMALQQQLLSTMAGLMGSLFSGGLSGIGGVPNPAVFGGFPNFGTNSRGGGGHRVGGSSGLNQFLGGPVRSSKGPASNAKHGASGTHANPRNSRDNKFKTLNVNIKSNPVMKQSDVIHDVRKAASQADLIGWNEISPDRYFQAIKSLGPEWGHYMPKDGNLRIPNPISYRKEEWKMLDNGFKKTHNGLAKTSPNRYITWARLKHKGSGQEVVRINTHLVSGAFSSQNKSNKGWRKEKWGEHMKQLSNLIDRFEKKGLKVVVGGDFNRNQHKVLGNQVAYDNNFRESTIGRSTLDYLMHGRNRGLKNLSGGVSRGFASDHDAVVGSYSLTGASRRR